MEWRGGLRWVGLRGLAMLELDLDPSSDVPHESRASRDCEEGEAWQLCHHLQGQSFGFEDAKFFSFLSPAFARSALIRISCLSFDLFLRPS